MQGVDLGAMNWCTIRSRGGRWLKEMSFIDYCHIKKGGQRLGDWVQCRSLMKLMQLIRPFFNQFASAILVQMKCVHPKGVFSGSYQIFSFKNKGAEEGLIPGAGDDVVSLIWLFLYSFPLFLYLASYAGCWTGNNELIHHTILRQMVEGNEFYRLLSPHKKMGTRDESGAGDEVDADHSPFFKFVHLIHLGSNGMCASEGSSSMYHHGKVLLWNGQHKFYWLLSTCNRRGQCISPVQETN